MNTLLTTFPACTRVTSLLQAIMETTKVCFRALFAAKSAFYDLHRGFLRENLGAINKQQPQIS